jgi:putative heme-binding domain-containing protein
VGLASRLGARSLDERAGEIVDSFLVQVRDDKRTEAERAAAATNLVEFRRSDAATAAMVLDLITPRASPEFATGLLEAAGRSEAPEVGASILERLGALTPAARPVALRVLLARTGWTEALLQALEDGRVQAAELALDQKQALASHPEKRLAERAKRILERGGGLPDPDRQKVLEEFLPVARQAGDAARGKEVYKKLCSKCHVHGEEGTRIGPDLTGMAVHPREELLTQMLDPSRSVEGNFRAYAVITTDGRVLSGLLASETRTSLELFDADGKKQFLRRDEIATLDASSKSLMPDGFEKQMAREEIADLLEFLARPGRFLPLDLRKAATVVSTRGMFFGEGSQAERLVFRDWSPKTFAGVPFVLVDPQEGRVPNVVLLYSPQGRIPPGMPRSVRLPVNVPARAVHFLSGVSGWGFPLGEKGSVTMILRLVYADGATEEHQLRNGEHFADYIRRVDVPGSQFAYQLRGQQLRYLSVAAERPEVIREIELVKGPDETAPIVMAVTVETRG